MLGQEEVSKERVIAPVGGEISFSVDRRVFEGIEGEEECGVKMCVIRQGVDDTGDAEVKFVIETNDFIDGIFVAEIFMGYVTGHDDAEGVFQCVFAVAFDEIDVKYAGEVIVGEHTVFFIKDLVAVVKRAGPVWKNAGYLLDIGKIRLEQGTVGGRDGAEMEGDDAVFVIEASGDAIDTVCFGIVSIVARLVEDIGEDDETAG